MAYTITVTRSAAKDLRALDDTSRRRVGKAIDALASDPRPDGVTKLAGTAKGDPPLYRIRVGDYRVTYQIADRELIILVVRVRHRGEVYR